MMQLIFILAYLMAPIPDGTLLFVEGGSPIVMEQTESPYSHVALIFNENDKPYVYEAVRPVVRKIPLSDYIKQLEKHKEIKLWIKKPKNLSEKDSLAMKEYCTNQLGRKYRITSYLLEQPTNAIHCGELTTKAMMAGGMDIKGNPCVQSPKTIMEFSSQWYFEKIKIHP